MPHVQKFKPTQEPARATSRNIEKMKNKYSTWSQQNDWEHYSAALIDGTAVKVANKESAMSQWLWGTTTWNGE